MNILVAGDTFVSNEFFIENLLSPSVVNLFQNAEFPILNLESPILYENQKFDKILKTGPHLQMSKQVATSILRNLHVKGVTLANNHILDYGSKGLMSTMDILKSEEIKFVGAGKNISDASKCLSIEKNGLKVGIVNFCENEWSIADSDKPGANPMDVIDNIKQIQGVKSVHDKVIVIVHGGNEYYNLPSPRMQKIYRFYAENGADIVIGHHTHCISGYEIYKGVPIFYSLGNFLFTKRKTYLDWYCGIVLDLSITSQKIDFKIHISSQNYNDFSLSLLEGSEKDKILRRIEEYSNIIQEEELLKSYWNDFVQKKYREYIHYFSPISSIQNRYIMGVLKKLNLKLYPKKTKALHLNLIRCEAHQDLVKEVLMKAVS